MTQLTLDSAESAARKEAGQAAVEESDKGFVEFMRRAARTISEESGFVSSDNLRVLAAELGMIPKHVNAWGAVFKGAQWKIVGRKKSAVPSCHHREIKIWQWVN